MQATSPDNQFVPSKIIQEAKVKIRPAQRFFAKFNNDGVMTSAAGLAYNLILAIVPILIALLSLLGFTLGRLNEQAMVNLINQIEASLPAFANAKDAITSAVTILRKNAGWLSILALLTAIFGGSRLFVAIEGVFAIIYRERVRPFIRQNVVAIAMLLVFLILAPCMLLSTSVPTVVLSLIKNSIFQQVPLLPGLAENTFVLTAASLLCGLIAAWIFFEMIYIVIPYKHISFRRSLPGSIIAAVLLEFFLLIFPFYISRFMGSYTGAIAFAVILLLFFYYFAVILLLGAEINAFFAEHVPPLPKNVSDVLADTFPIH
jgi:YihY family inner membrane protein